jgi:flagellar hook-associated protein 2
MSQTISNDYVSMINKSGSGYNIPEIVDAIVAAEIEPVKEIVTAQKEQVGASISGMSVLKSSMLATQTLVNSMSSGSLFTSNHSPNSNYMRSTIVDQASLKEGSNLFENVVIAKPQIWRADGETAIADQTITIEFGNNGANDGGWTPSSPVRSADVVLSGDTLVSAVAKLNNVTGLTAEIVQLDSNSSEYSVVLTSETGAKNGFKMTNNAGTLWKTDNGTGDFFQQSLDATFDLNGQSYSRSSNNITDIIPGLQVELLSSRTDEQSITVTKSSESIQKIVETLIADLNAYKSDLNTLGFIDEAGDEDGELVNSSFLRIAKRRFARLMTEPITGFGDTNIYFVDFGIKTGKDGSLLFDQKSFNRTYSNTPEKFDALTQDKVYSSDPLSTPTSLPDSGLPPGKYEYRQSSETLFSFNTSQSLATSVSGSGTDYRRSADEYIGFSLNTYHSNPTDYDIYVGHSAKTKINNFFADALSDSGNLDATVDFYKDRDLSLDARLTKIDKREALLQAQYTKRFAAMEKVVNASTSSAEYVTQLVDGWNKS